MLTTPIICVFQWNASTSFTVQQGGNGQWTEIVKFYESPPPKIQHLVMRFNMSEAHTIFQPATYLECVRRLDGGDLEVNVAEIGRGGNFHLDGFLSGRGLLNVQLFSTLGLQFRRRLGHSRLVVVVLQHSTTPGGRRSQRGVGGS